MKKMKVYLAKSNRANPDLVARVRQTLSKYNLEIVEFKGGAYSHDSLLQCDRMIIVPAEGDVTEDYRIIGKGLYEQINVFLSKTYNVSNIIVVDEQLDAAIFGSSDIIDDDDYVNYADLYLSEDYCDLNEILSNTLKYFYLNSDISIYASTKIVGVTKSKYYYLIGKNN
jgi:hypothetical protein